MQKVTFMPEPQGLQDMFAKLRNKYNRHTLDKVFLKLSNDLF